MRIKKITLLLLISVLLVISNMNVFAIDEGKLGSITLQIKAPSSSTGIEGVNVNIYQVASVSNDKYVKTADFSSSSFDVDKIDGLSAKQNQNYALQLAKYIQNEGISYTSAKTSDKQGNVVFNDLSLGIYLVLDNNGEESYINPFLISVPQLNDGNYVYDVNANPKMEMNIVTTKPSEPVDTTKPSETTTTDLTETTQTTNPNTTEPSTSQSTTGNTTTNITTTTVSTDETTTTKPDKPDLPHTGQVWWPVYVLAIAGIILFTYGFLKRKGQVNE